MIGNTFSKVPRLCNPCNWILPVQRASVGFWMPVLVLTNVLRSLNDHQVSTRCPPFTNVAATTCNVETPDASIQARTFHHCGQVCLCGLFTIHVLRKGGYKVRQRIDVFAPGQIVEYCTSSRSAVA